MLTPLYELLRRNQQWKWCASQSRAFNKSKELLTSAKLLLVHFDTTLPLVLACDALQYGIGTVLAHKLLDGSEQPIGYALRSLNAAEKNYSQLEKEGLACLQCETFLLLPVRTLFPTHYRPQAASWAVEQGQAGFTTSLSPCEKMVSVLVNV